MLSRIAESFFWLGRYIERAEATTRILGEHYQLIVEDQSISEPMACAVLLDALSLPHIGVEDGLLLVRSVVGESGLPATITGAVGAGRDNARAVRDSLSTDTFEALNAAHLFLSRGLTHSSSPGVGLHRILERLLVVNGVIDWTMPRDEAYYFMKLGRNIERIDMMGRLLAMRHEQLWPNSGPVAVLRAAGALSAFLRKSGPFQGADVRKFLVLDETFPRSMRMCAADAELAVRALESLGVGDGGMLLREVGMLRSSLEYTTSDDPVEINRLIADARQAAIRASNQANKAFFRQHGTIVWSH
ncbi:MAG: alpha-E domain-containing protein [Candidatus Nanopelagicales bacterium]|nr:alpha-E domain-containing protein [Candidatus Nanopelagicales bacterium]